MTAIAEQLFEKAMALGDEERIALAERLFESVHDDPEVLAEHLKIVQRRVDEIESGMVEAISHDEAFRMIHEALSEARRGA